MTGTVRPLGLVLHASADSCLATMVVPCEGWRELISLGFAIAEPVWTTTLSSN